MSKTIKQNLFRFVTLRNPQLIDNKEDHPGFVYHPNESDSTFFAAIEGVKEADKQGVLKTVANTFPALKTRKETRSLNESLYRFSSWLMRNKNNLSSISIKENLNGAIPLGIEKKEDLLVWDNLIYQTITKESVYVREALIQLLIANQFLESFNKFSEGATLDFTFTDDQEKAFIRRANASVVISKSLFDDSTVLNTETRKRMTVSQEKALEKDSETQVAKTRIDELKNLIKELKKVEVKYKKDNKKAYKEALKSHNLEVEALEAVAEPEIVQEIDPKTGEVITTEKYPYLKTPKFEFQKVDALNSNYLKSQITDEALAVFEGQELGIYDDFNGLYGVVNNIIADEEQIVVSNTSGNTATVVVGGSTVQVNQPVPILEPYCFRISISTKANGKSSLFMHLGTGYENAEVVSANYTLTGDLGATYTSTNVQKLGSVGTLLRQLLFPEGIIIIADNYTISGQFTLDNGVVLTFNESGFSLKPRSGGIMGCCTVKSGTGDDTDPATVVNGRIYGVTNLGVADFRRVEQEVCCYVPGEVSHIENIMAREYKERSTRSLNSVETTSETTTERETEQLTDTTTTERNEMQSEVSSVINEDQSQATGASANMSYSPKAPGAGGLTINTGAYADFSSSSSSSNSNSQAQTYAQEVTERAMERIVQKVSTKRTSRILKEFEENNKHGFDNTKGDKHVTGVYRWVDKIYKNKLINYGKRLMYEFAIPEPGRFFKEAIWKKYENNELDSSIVLPKKPLHPSEISQGISSSSELDEFNYQRIASKYNAEVVPKPKDKIFVGESFSHTTQALHKDEYTEVTAGDTVYELPDGYKTNAATVAWHQSIEGGRGTYIIVGQEKVGPNNNSSPVDVTLPDYVGKVPVSFSQMGHHSGSVNVEFECDLTPEGEQQWQNETYNTIIEAYNERLREYNEAMQANQVISVGAEEKLTFNPLHNRGIEQRELKRIAIDLLAAPKGHSDNVSKNDYVDGSKTEVKKSSALDAHVSTVKFFEQAFNWDIMAYTFYPYFYAKQEDWKGLFQSQDVADPLFQAFLQSGMARTVVPVRPGFEDAVNWYMSTGELWEGHGLVTDQDDDLYVSVAEEMQTIEGEVEGTWETRLPTSLTVIQAESAALLEGGLPCFCNENAEDNTLISSSELLSGGDSAGVGVDLLN